MCKSCEIDNLLQDYAIAHRGLERANITGEFAKINEYTKAIKSSYRAIKQFLDNEEEHDLNADLQRELGKTRYL